MTVLRVERTLPASPQRVWHALTDAAALAAWFWPQHFGTTARVDARPGGELRIAAANGLAVSGRFREVEAPRRLVFTWRWDGDAALAGSDEDQAEDEDDEETLVTIELSEADGGTALMLTHEGFATDSTRDDHHTGWSDCLDRLPAWLVAQDRTPLWT